MNAIGFSNINIIAKHASSKIPRTTYVKLPPKLPKLSTESDYKITAFDFYIKRFTLTTIPTKTLHLRIIANVVKKLEQRVQWTIIMLKAGGCCAVGHWTSVRPSQEEDATVVLRLVSVVICFGAKKCEHYRGMIHQKIILFGVSGFLLILWLPLSKLWFNYLKFQRVAPQFLITCNKSAA